MSEEKTVEEWFLHLPPGYNGRALSNLVVEKKQKVVCSISKAIMTGFTWDSTPEGGDFWRAVHCHYFEKESDFGGDAVPQLPQLPDA